jgi:hypothetical protein
MIRRRPVQPPHKERPAESFKTAGRACSDYLFFYDLKPEFSIVICLLTHQFFGKWRHQVYQFTSITFLPFATPLSLNASIVK